MRDALRSQVNKREKYVEQDKAENLKIDKILNKNNQMFIDLNKKRIEEEKAKMVEYVKESKEMEESFRAIRGDSNMKKNNGEKNDGIKLLHY